MARTQKTKVSKNLFGKSQQSVCKIWKVLRMVILLGDDKDSKDEDNVEQIFDLGSCFTCGGSEDKNQPATWMGSNYHRSCLTEDYTYLTFDEI